VPVGGGFAIWAPAGPKFCDRELALEL